MGAPERIKRRFGLPWKGYQPSVAPHLAPPDKATSDGPASTRRSKNFLFNPLEGKFYRRAGMAIVGATAGILGATMVLSRCRQMLSLASTSIADGYPTYAGLWSEELANSEWGVVHFYDNTDTPHDHVLGEEFGTTQYPAAAPGASYMKPWPYMRTTDGTIGRFNTEPLQAQASAGSRRVLEVNDTLHSPNLHGTPWYWNKKFNQNNADTSDIFRTHHTGRPSPLGLPTVITGTAGTSGDPGSWHEGDKFYISVAYQYADGSVSMPIIPRDVTADIDYAPEANNSSGFGLITLKRGATPFNAHYRNLTWTTIPIGPDGVVARYLLRTPKLNGTVGGTTGSETATTEGTEPSPLDLRICGYIPNNTQDFFQDDNGNDLSLLADPLLVRFDHIMQPPARYISSFDGRILVGYTKPNPVAIYITPNVNVDDNAATIDDVNYSYALAGGTLTLYKDAGSTTITSAGALTIQRLVDKINNTITSGSGGKWFAAVAPGSDRAAYCDADGTAGANDNLFTTTTVETGDVSGRIRAYGSSWPAPIFFSTAYLANFKTEKRRVAFTMGGPGMPANAGASFAAGNFRTAPESWGNYMGSGALRNGALVCFSKAIGTIENRKGGSTGLDEDYRLYDLNLGRGCISDASIVEFNGAVGYLTADGYVVSDGKEEVLISGDVWNPGTQTGEWAYEIGQCAEAAASDTDIARFSAKVMGGKLYVQYLLTGTARTLATDGQPDSWMIYDFTGSEQFSGLRGVLRPDGTPYGWSTRLTRGAAAAGIGPMCEVVTAAGIKRFMANESTGSQLSGSSGRIEQIETTTQDAGAAIVSNLWTARDLADHLNKKSMQEVTPVYKKQGTGHTIDVYLDGLGTTSKGTLTLATTGSLGNFAAPPLPLPQLARTPARSHEYLIADDGVSLPAPEEWGFEVDGFLLDSYT